MKTRHSFLTLVVLAMALVFSSCEGVCLAKPARAPTKKVFLRHQASIPTAAEIQIVSIPPLTVGYDVICNLSTAQSVAADSSASLRLSTTVAERARSASSGTTHQLPPEPVSRE